MKHFVHTLVTYCYKYALKIINETNWTFHFFSRDSFKNPAMTTKYINPWLQSEIETIINETNWSSRFFSGDCFKNPIMTLVPKYIGRFSYYTVQTVSLILHICIWTSKSRHKSIPYFCSCSNSHITITHTHPE